MTLEQAYLVESGRLLWPILAGVVGVVVVMVGIVLMAVLDQ